MNVPLWVAAEIIIGVLAMFALIKVPKPDNGPYSVDIVPALMGLGIIGSWVVLALLVLVVQGCVGWSK